MFAVNPENVFKIHITMILTMDIKILVVIYLKWLFSNSTHVIEWKQLFNVCVKGILTFDLLN